MRHGNLFGIFAIVLWASLASLGVLVSSIPPFQLISMTFLIAFFIGLVLWKKENKGILVHLKLPLKVWIIGVCGLFGNHFFYFLAIRNAPAVEANLINYLWPLFIVLFSTFLPKEKLRWFHIVGTFLGLIGVFFVVSKGGGLTFEGQYLWGYIYALIAALIWAFYSIFSRHFGDISTGSVGGFCVVTAILSFLAHLAFETTVIPNTTELLAILALGLGPVGGAFFIWDYAVKKGDIQLLGSLSYMIPLLSTFLLIFLGLSTPSSTIWIACFFIVTGSIISSLPLFRRLLNTHNQPLC